MADERLIASLNLSITPREILPKEWQDNLVLDYLDEDNQRLLVERIQLIGAAVYQLQLNQEDILTRLQAVEDALP